jgi:hypothetical protein
VTRKHGLGGQPGCYAVDLTFRDLAGGGEPHVIGYSGDMFDHPKGPYHYGAFWAGLNDGGVSVYRHANNILDDQFRLRPWQRLSWPNIPIRYAALGYDGLSSVRH